MFQEKIADYAEQLQKSRIFQALTPQQFEQALDFFQAEYSEYKKGDFLHQAGKPLKKFGFVLLGVVQVCTYDIDGNRMMMANVVPGITFGEALCYLQVQEPAVYIYASENAAVLWLSLEKVYTKAVSDFELELQRRFTAMLAERMLRMNHRIQVLSRISLRDKLIAYFSEMVQQTGNTTFLVPFNREDMAVYIGTNRSALSRELSRMKQEGWIDYYKNTFRILKK